MNEQNEYKGPEWLPYTEATLNWVNRRLGGVLVSLIFLILSIIASFMLRDFKSGSELASIAWGEIAGTIWVTFSSIVLGWQTELWFDEVKSGDKQREKAITIGKEIEDYLRTQAQDWQNTLNALTLKNPSDDLMEIILFFWVDEQVRVRSTIERSANVIEALGYSSSLFIQRMLKRYVGLRDRATELALATVQDDPNMEKKLKVMLKKLDSLSDNLLTTATTGTSIGPTPRTLNYESQQVTRDFHAEVVDEPITGTD